MNARPSLFAASFSRSPAAAAGERAPGLSSAGTDRLVWAFLALGLLARCVRYFLRFPLWDDESFLCANFIDTGFADMLRPLGFHQVAPLLFLWLELACAKLLGFSEWSLRLPAFIASIGSLFLFRHVARRVLAGGPQVAAMALFSVTYGCIRYAAEAKPYGIDLFASLLGVALAVEFQKSDQSRWIWRSALWAPLAVGVSFPAVFTGGAVSLALAALCRTTGNRSNWLAWLTFNASLLGSFLGFYWLSARLQGQAEAAFMHGCWQDQFPPVADPWRLPGWLLETHAGPMFAFPVGGQHGGSTATALALLAGAGLVWKLRIRLIGWLCLAPLGLHLLAAAMQKYPYGGHVKFGMYAAPGICLVAGLGMAGCAAVLDRWRFAGRGMAGLLTVLALAAAGSIARDIAMPYKTTSDQRARDFARWFWFNAEREGEAVCLKSDWGIDFAPAAWSELTWAAMYRCNRAIYSPRQRNGDPPRLEQVTSQWPLRCVEFRSGQHPEDASARRQWLESMNQRYELVAHDSYPLLEYGKFDRVLATVDHLDVYKFVPRPPALAAPPEETLRK